MSDKPCSVTSEDQPIGSGTQAFLDERAGMHIAKLLANMKAYANAEPGWNPNDERAALEEYERRKLEYLRYAGQAFRELMEIVK